MLKMKKLISFLLVALMLFALMPLSAFAAPTAWNGTVASGFASGKGTISDPYIIKTAPQLAFFAKQVNDKVTNFDGKYIKLASDIVLNDTSKSDWGKSYYAWDPIGYSFSENGSEKMYCFSGTFDGNGKKITGVVINNNSRNDAGLFGDISNATVQNLTLDGAYIVANDGIGVVAGYSQFSTITNCKIINATIVGNKNIGGVVGHSYRDKIENSSVSASIAGNTRVGGIAGICAGGMGDSGYAVHAFIENCSANVTVYSATPDDNTDDNYFGGIAGAVEYVFIENCSVKGSVNADSLCGGITGSAAYSYIENCVSESAVSGENQIGGIAGSAYEVNFTDCINKYWVLGNEYVGGIVGSTLSKDRLKGCKNTGVVQGTRCVGGLVGLDEGLVKINKSYNTGNIALPAPGQNLYSSQTGGIIGMMTLGAYISECYNSGNVFGNNYIGGLVGYLDGTATVSTSSLYCCYNAGKVYALNYYGGIVGAASQYANFFDCYYLDSSSALGIHSIIKNATLYIQSANPSNITALSDAAMKQQSSFKYFDFKNQWVIDTNADYKYPTFIADQYILGDVDGDNDIDADDYILLKRVVFGLAKLDSLKNPSTALIRSDVTKDGSITADDYILLKRVFFGMAKI